MLRALGVTVSLLACAACRDTGPAEELDPAGLWRGTISRTAGSTETIQLLIHPLGSTVTIIGNIGDQVTITGTAAMLPDALVEVGLTVYTPDAPGYVGRLRLDGNELRGRLVTVREPVDSSTTLSVRRELIANGNVIGRWTMATTMRSFAEKPSEIGDTLVFTRGGSFSQIRYEEWREFNYRCSGTAVGSYSVSRDTVVVVSHTPPATGCLIMYRDTLHYAGGRLTNPFRTGRDSIIDTYSRR